MFEYWSPLEVLTVENDIGKSIECKSCSYTQNKGTVTVIISKENCVTLGSAVLNYLNFSVKRLTELSAEPEEFGCEDVKPKLLICRQIWRLM